MTTEDFDALIDKLCTAPDSQLDAKVFPALQRCKNNPPNREQQLLDILDCCCYASLASSFVMLAIHFLYEQSGGSTEKRFNREDEEVLDNDKQIKEVFNRVFHKENKE